MYWVKSYAERGVTSFLLQVVEQRDSNSFVMRLLLRSFNKSSVLQWSSVVCCAFSVNSGSVLGWELWCAVRDNLFVARC